MNPEFERHLALARHLFDARHPEDAARECETALRLEPDANHARLLLARALRQLGRLDEARREVKTALETDPDDVDALYLFSMIAPRRAEALAAIEAALALRPHLPALHTQLAAVHLRSDLPWFLRVKQRPSARRAEAAARAALKLNPRDALAHRYVALALISQNRVEEAREHVMTSLALHPENPRSHVLLSLLRNNQNDAAGAESALREALRLDPDNRDLQRDLKIHVAGEQIFGWMGTPAPVVEDDANDAAFKVFEATWGKLPPLWRLPILVAAQIATMTALATLPWHRIGSVTLQTVAILGLLLLFCYLPLNLNYAARPYLARVPSRFLPRDLKKRGKPDTPSP
ncbi:MAG: tetratricopeptide repeat protein [Armatimonadetes bacterium]|nr:tetratricopeptide repeat protein [Armatimonadota bacterium]